MFDKFELVWGISINDLREVTEKHVYIDGDCEQSYGLGSDREINHLAIIAYTFNNVFQLNFLNNRVNISLVDSENSENQNYYVAKIVEENRQAYYTNEPVCKIEFYTESQKIREFIMDKINSLVNECVTAKNEEKSRAKTEKIKQDKYFEALLEKRTDNQSSHSDVCDDNSQVVISFKMSYIKNIPVEVPKGISELQTIREAQRIGKTIRKIDIDDSDFFGAEIRIMSKDGKPLTNWSFV